VEISELDWFVINKVKELRIAKGISQVALSQKMELADGAVGKIENPKERAKYNIRHLNLLPKILDCLPSDLLPKKALPNDMIRLTLRIIRANNRGSQTIEVIRIQQILPTGQRKS
jgi:transcriptional regulator with XRE-family HTH domain